MMYTDEQIDRMLFPAEKKRIMRVAKRSRGKASELCLYLYDTKQYEDGKWFQPEIGFYDAMPFEGHRGQIMARLAELSITHTIVEIIGEYDSVSLFLRESPDHQTNIDADVIEAIVGKEEEYTNVDD